MQGSGHGGADRDVGDGGVLAPGDSFVDSMLRRGFGVVPLPSAVVDDVASVLHQDGPEFFGQATQEKLRFAQPHVDAHGCPTYRGYVQMNGVRELLFLRPRVDGSFGAEHGALPSSAAMNGVVCGLHKLGLRLLADLGVALGGVGDELTELADPCPAAHVRAIGSGGGGGERAERAQRELSSILTLIHYDPTPGYSDDPDVCADHVDYTLLTLIPLGCARGLEVLDVTAPGFVQPEVEVVMRGEPPEQFAVVLAGEALERVTGGRITATQHKVTAQFGQSGRVSCPYLLYARADARLAAVCARQGAAAAVADPPLAADFVRASQLRKASAVYAKEDGGVG